MTHSRHFALFILLKAILLLCCFGCAPQPNAPATDASSPTPTIVHVAYPDHLTRFSVVSVDSKVEYVVQETFLENVGAIINFDPEPGPVTTVGTTRDISGDILIHITEEEANVFSGSFEVDLRSLRSNQERRDERIRSDWLESYRYPTAKFVISKVVGKAGVSIDEPWAFDLFGDLTVRDVTVPIVLAAEATLVDDTIRATASGPLRMSDFGVVPPALAGIVEVEDTFVLQVTITAVSR